MEHALAESILLTIWLYIKFSFDNLLIMITGIYDNEDDLKKFGLKSFMEWIKVKSTLKFKPHNQILMPLTYSRDQTWYLSFILHKCTLGSIFLSKHYHWNIWIWCSINPIDLLPWHPANMSMTFEFDYVAWTSMWIFTFIHSMKLFSPNFFKSSSLS